MSSPRTFAVQLLSDRRFHHSYSSRRVLNIKSIISQCNPKPHNFFIQPSHDVAARLFFQCPDDALEATVSLWERRLAGDHMFIPVPEFGFSACTVSLCDSDSCSSDSENFGSDCSYSYKDDKMEFFLNDTQKALLIALRSTRREEHLPCYFYKKFWEDVANTYNRNNQDNPLNFNEVLLHFQQIVEMYNNDLNMNVLNTLQEIGTIKIPKASFIFVEDGGPNNQFFTFHMRNDDRKLDSSIPFAAPGRSLIPGGNSSLQANMGRPLNPGCNSSRQANMGRRLSPKPKRKSCIPDEDMEAFLKISSNMSGEDCGHLILKANVGSNAFNHLVKLPEYKRSDAAKVLVSQSKRRFKKVLTTDDAMNEVPGTDDTMSKVPESASR